VSIKTGGFGVTLLAKEVVVEEGGVAVREEEGSHALGLWRPWGQRPLSWGESRGHTGRPWR
jgi:hypothetical protein